MRRGTASVRSRWTWRRLGRSCAQGPILGLVVGSRLSGSAIRRLYSVSGLIGDGSSHRSCDVGPVEVLIWPFRCELGGMAPSSPRRPVRASQSSCQRAGHRATPGHDHRYAQMEGTKRRPPRPSRQAAPEAASLSGNVSRLHLAPARAISMRTDSKHAGAEATAGPVAHRPVGGPESDPPAMSPAGGELP